MGEHRCVELGGIPCFIAGCDVPPNVQPASDASLWKRQAYANHDLAMELSVRLAHADGTIDDLNDKVEHLDRYVEQLLQTIEHLESENHLLSDHISGDEEEIRRLTDRTLALESNLQWFI